MMKVCDITKFNRYILFESNVIIKNGTHTYYQDILRLVFGIDMKNYQKTYWIEDKEFYKLKDMLKDTFHERFLEDAISK